MKQKKTVPTDQEPEIRKENDAIHTERPIHVIGATRSLAVRLACYGTVLLFLALGILGWLLGSRSYSLDPLAVRWEQGLGSVLVYLVTIVGHEAIHGLFFRIFGGRPRFGAGMMSWFLPYVYASAPGAFFSLSQMTAIGLAPLVVWSAVSLPVAALYPGLATYAGVVFVSNFSGAVGDLWMVAQIWRFHDCLDLRFEDLNRGLAIYSPDPKAIAVAGRLSIAGQRRSPLLARLVVRTVIASAFMAFVSPLLAILLDVLNVNRMLIGPASLPLFAFERPAQGGFILSSDLNALAVAGLAFAVLSLLVDYRKRPPAGQNESIPDQPAPDLPPHPALLLSVCRGLTALELSGFVIDWSTSGSV